MLTNLRIENFAIIDQLELDFSSGLVIMTGETGKPIVMSRNELNGLLGRLDFFLGAVDAQLHRDRVFRSDWRKG